MTELPTGLTSGPRSRALVTALVLALSMVAGVGAGVVAAPFTGQADPGPTVSPVGPASTSPPEVAASASPSATPSVVADLPKADVALAEDEFVVPRGEANDTRLYRGQVGGVLPPQKLSTRKRDRVNSPTLSSDRRTLIYVDRTVGRLSTVAVDGKGDRQLFDGLPSRCDAVGHVSWSRADPAVLVIRCTSADGPDRLMVIDLAGNVIRTLDDTHPLLDDPVISPDGQLVAYWAADGSGRPGGGGIYTRRLDGQGSPTRLTSDVFGRDADPAWSPDGTMIAFRRRTTPSNPDVYVMASDGTDVRPVVTGPAADAKPLFSPDGTQLMIISNRSSDGSPGPTSDLYLVDLDGGDLEPLGLAAEEISTPVWSSR